MDIAKIEKRDCLVLFATHWLKVHRQRMLLWYVQTVSALGVTAKLKLTTNRHRVPNATLAPEQGKQQSRHRCD